MKPFLSLYRDILGLIYPDVCVTCGSHLPSGIRFICIKCRHDMPRTDFHLEQGNPVEQIFWGRVPLQHAASMFYYIKGSRYQKLIYIMKYHGNKELGYEMGKIYGRLLIGTSFSQAGVIVPVPLHPRKMRKRGFNQSEWIGKGLAESLQIPMITKHLYRSVNTKTQTRKSRLERWQNVENVFKIRSVDAFRNRHVLLVDDVVTTGATLESCAGLLTGCTGTSVSVLTLGYATL
ncbi:MAG: ComF family protein [Bacteroidales bacterium]|nr:ComF family protein [Bacteroidales bacterium]MBS3774671.1 ComF family protein [Bacteroidales bacterium]